MKVPANDVEVGYVLWWCYPHCWQERHLLCKLLLPTLLRELLPDDTQSIVQIIHLDSFLLELCLQLHAWACLKPQSATICTPQAER